SRKVPHAGTRKGRRRRKRTEGCDYKEKLGQCATGLRLSPALLDLFQGFRRLAAYPAIGVASMRSENGKAISHFQRMETQWFGAKSWFDSQGSTATGSARGAAACSPALTTQAVTCSEEPKQRRQVSFSAVGRMACSNLASGGRNP